MKSAKPVSSIFFRQENQCGDFGKCLMVRCKSEKWKTSIGKIEVPVAILPGSTNRSFTIRGTTMNRSQALKMAVRMFGKNAALSIGRAANFAKQEELPEWL